MRKFMAGFGVAALMAILAVAPVAGPARAQGESMQRGPVTNLPLPRFVSLKSNDGRVRRGPGQAHRVDWIFPNAGVPLRITAEHENWRRVEDAEGAGGWMHYTLLSGVRTALVVQDMLDVLAKPDPRASVEARAEAGAVVRLSECGGDWCRISRDGLRGWVPRAALWGVSDTEDFR